MTADRLYVHYNERLVGELWIGDNAAFSFRYSDDWLHDGSWPISQTLPTPQQTFQGGPAQTFFSNLLPEGAARTAVCRRLGISESNDFALLAAIGGECAGALTLDTSHPRSAPREPAYEKLSKRRLQRTVDDEDLAPLLIGGTSTRLSLAGAQDKLPVSLIDGDLYLPLDSAPSTHILKLPNRRYPHLPINEAFVMGLARRMGLEVVDTQLWMDLDPGGLLVMRYDRQTADGETKRLHQEDLCQALGFPPSRKYEQENGPSFTSIVELVRSRLARPLIDVNRLLEWQVFNVIAGNSDGHAKNLSVLYDVVQGRLAPFYDLVATRHYESLDRKLAQSVGGRRDPDQLHRTQWEQFAIDLAIAPRLVVATVQRLVERTREVLAGWTTEFRSQYGKQAMLETLSAAIDKRARATLRRLRS